MALLDGNLLPASFRGVPFAVEADTLGVGRRLAVHQYPGKDTPWPEDMGKEARVFQFRGFIVEDDAVFGGGPIQLQRLLLLAAFEKKGPGLLTHPSLGILNVVLRRGSVSQELDARRRSAVDAEFIESGKQSFPALLSTGSGVLSAANLCKVALVVDGVRAIAIGAARGNRRQDLSTTTAVWANKAVELGADATALHRLASQLPGSNGRFSAGGNLGLKGQRATAYTADTVISDLVQSTSNARVAILAASNTIAAAAAVAQLGYAADVGSATVALVQALADACADPADAIRLLTELIAFAPVRPEAATGIGLAVSGMVRRAAAASLTIAVASYQPSSSDDAAAMIRSVGNLVDDQATQAADAGDDASYKALRAARGAIVKDLRARGSTLAQVRTFKTGRPLPAIVLANRWYRDVGRASQIVTQAPKTPSPLFMPTEMQALAV